MKKLKCIIMCSKHYCFGNKKEKIIPMGEEIRKLCFISL